MMSVKGFRLCITSFGTPFSSIVAACETRLVVICTPALATSQMAERAVYPPDHREARKLVTTKKLDRL
jgi:hypothetical protein